MRSGFSFTAAEVALRFSKYAFYGEALFKFVLPSLGGPDYLSGMEDHASFFAIVLAASAVFQVAKDEKNIRVSASQPQLSREDVQDFESKLRKTLGADFQFKGTPDQVEYWQHLRDAQKSGPFARSFALAMSATGYAAALIFLGRSGLDLHSTDIIPAAFSSFAGSGTGMGVAALADVAIRPVKNGVRRMLGLQPKR